MRLRWKLGVLGLMVAVAACASEPRRSSDDDDGGGGASSSASAGGSTSVPGGPEVTSLQAIPATASDGSSVSITALVTDADGLDDVVGGFLTSPDGLTSYGPFATLGGGTWTLTLSWQQLLDAGPDDGSDRLFRAEFSDTEGKLGSAAVSVGMPAALEDCTDICNAVFDCGLEDNNCPGFIEGERALFLYGSNNDGCITLCENSPLQGLIDTNDCSGTVQLLSSANPQFACTCSEGVSSPSCLEAP